MARYCRITATTTETSRSALLLCAKEKGVEIPVQPGLKVIPDLGSEEHGIGAWTGDSWKFRLVPLGQKAPSYPEPDDPEAGFDWKPASGIKFLFEDLGLWPMTTNIAMGVSWIQSIGQKTRHLPEAQAGYNPICIVDTAEPIPIKVDRNGVKNAVKKVIFKPRVRYTSDWAERLDDDPHFGLRTVSAAWGSADMLEVLRAPSAHEPGLIIDNEKFTNTRTASVPMQPRSPIPPPNRIEDDEIKF